MISIDKVVKRRGNRTLLKNISFVAEPGRITGFVGPNGAGKSTTLRVLLGLDKATSGTATIGGYRYRDLRFPLTTVGAVLDGPGAHPSRTARAHLSWVADSNKISRKRVREVLDKVGLANDAKRRVNTYSLGMGQRLGIAVALLGQPEYLVLDEPLNGLDPDGIRWIRSLLKDHAAAGGTVLLSSHLMSELTEIADDIVVISEGQITACGTLSDLTQNFQNLEEAFFAYTQKQKTL